MSGGEREASAASESRAPGWKCNKQNWVQGWHNGKRANLLKWPIFLLTKLVFFRARALLKENTVTVYPKHRMFLYVISFTSYVCIQILTTVTVFSFNKALGPEED